MAIWLVCSGSAISSFFIEQAMKELQRNIHQLSQRLALSKKSSLASKTKPITYSIAKIAAFFLQMSLNLFGIEIATI